MAVLDLIACFFAVASVLVCPATVHTEADRERTGIAFVLLAGAVLAAAIS